MIIYCDNSASCQVLNTRFSRDPFLQSCLHEICFHATINEFQIRARDFSSGDNRIPDYLSRWDLSPNFEKIVSSRSKGLDSSGIYYTRVTFSVFSRLVKQSTARDTAHGCVTFYFS